MQHNNYSVIEAKDVLSTLGTGAVVLIADLGKRRIINCSDLTIGQINVYIEDENCVFYECS